MQAKCHLKWDITVRIPVSFYNEPGQLFKYAYTQIQ